jgi:hypothetical protein
LLPRHNLHRLVGVFLDVADRELLALDLFRFLLSQNPNVFFSPGLTSPRHGVQTSDRPGKVNKPVERCVLSSFQIAQGLGFNVDFRAWEHLLRIHE